MIYRVDSKLFKSFLSTKGRSPRSPQHSATAPDSAHDGAGKILIIPEEGSGFPPRLLQPGERVELISNDSYAYAQSAEPPRRFWSSYGTYAAAERTRLEYDALFGLSTILENDVPPRVVHPWEARLRAAQLSRSRRDEADESRLMDLPESLFCSLTAPLDGSTQEVDI